MEPGRTGLKKLIASTKARQATMRMERMACGRSLLRRTQVGLARLAHQ